MKFSLKAVMVKQGENTGIIKRLLHAHVGNFEKPRSKKVIHASELTHEGREFCPRQWRLQDLYEVKDKTRLVDTALETTFAEGRDKQARFNNDWLRDRMVGHWRCRACGRRAEFCTYATALTRINTSPDHTCVIEYEEVRCEDPVSGHSGGLDGLVMVKDGEKLRLVEYKIMDKDMFKKLAAPLAEHKVRTQLYLRTIARSKQSWAKQVRTDEASLIYQMRGFGMKDDDGDMSPFREFTIKRDHKGVAGYVSLAHAVTASRRQPERGFPCRLCPSMMSPLADACPVAKPCFGSKHPPTISWLQHDGTPKHTGPEVRWIATGDSLVPAHEDEGEEV